jgi:hypothetical protein
MSSTRASASQTCFMLWCYAREPLGDHRVSQCLESAIEFPEIGGCAKTQVYGVQLNISGFHRQSPLAARRKCTCTSSGCPESAIVRRRCCIMANLASGAT